MNAFMLMILRKQSNTKDKHLSDGDLSELVVLSEVFPSLAPNNSCLYNQEAWVTHGYTVQY